MIGNSPPHGTTPHSEGSARRNGGTLGNRGARLAGSVRRCLSRSSRADPPPARPRPSAYLMLWAIMIVNPGTGELQGRRHWPGPRPGHDRRRGGLPLVSPRLPCPLASGRLVQQGPGRPREELVIRVGRGVRVLDIPVRGCSQHQHQPLRLVHFANGVRQLAGDPPHCCLHLWLPPCSDFRLAVRPAAGHWEKSLNALSRTTGGASPRLTYLRLGPAWRRRPAAGDQARAAGPDGNRFA